MTQDRFEAAMSEIETEIANNEKTAARVFTEMKNLVRQAAKASEAARQEGDVVVTRDGVGTIIAVTRQDSEGRVLSVIAEAAPAPAPVVPEGFSIFRADGGMTVETPQGGYVTVRRSQAGNSAADEVLYDLALALSAAQEQPAEQEQYVYEIVDATDDEKYYPMGMYSTLEKARAGIVGGSGPMTEHAEEVCTNEVRRHKLDGTGWGTGKVALTVQWEENTDGDWFISKIVVGE